MAQNGIGRLLRNPWVGTLLLALPGLLLLAVAANFRRSNPAHSIGLFFTMQSAFRLILLAGVGLLLLVYGTRLALRRRKRAQTDAPRGLATLLPITLGLATLAWCGYLAWDRQLFHSFMGDQTDVDRMARLRNADLSRVDGPVAASAWPQWRGAFRDGTSSETGLKLDWSAAPPTVLWRVPIKAGYSSIAVDGDRLYTMDRDDADERVLCFNSADGKLLWEHRYPADYSPIDPNFQDGPRATPTVVDNRVYTVGAPGTLLCLEAGAAAPKVLWRHDLTTEFQARPPRWGVACSPLVVDELVVVQPGGKQGSLAAFHRITGDLVWTCRDDVSGYSSPIVATLAGVRQIVAATATNLVGIRPSDGKELWSYRWVTDYECNVATPVVAGNYVFYSSAYNRGCLLLEIQELGDGLMAAPVYVKNNKLMRCHHATCVFHDGFLYGCDSGADVLKCVDLRTGEETWASRGLRKKTACILADGHLIALTEEGTLASVAADPREFRLKGKMELFGGDARQIWTLPALARGRLYVRSSKELVCLRLTD